MILSVCNHCGLQSIMEQKDGKNLMQIMTNTILLKKKKIYLWLEVLCRLIGKCRSVGTNTKLKVVFKSAQSSNLKYESTLVKQTNKKKKQPTKNPSRIKS